MKEPLGFPQTYIISTKYKTQQQKKQSLGFPQTYIISTKYKNKVGNPGVVSFVVVFCILLR
jgi:hypothetical protein